MTNSAGTSSGSASPVTLTVPVFQSPTSWNDAAFFAIGEVQEGRGAGVRQVDAGRGRDRS